MAGKRDADQERLDPLWRILMAGDLGFLGVSTQHSLIQRLFPIWAEVLGFPNARLRGFDHPPEATAAELRQRIQAIQEDPGLAGALVTTHKVAVWESARDLFVKVDAHAERLHEISCLSRNEEGQLVGHAKDPETASWAIQQILPRNHWLQHREAEVLILGAGGAGLALAWSLLAATSRPKKIHLAETRTGRFPKVQEHLAACNPESWCLHELASAQEADALIAGLAPESLIVNATGLGKDRPGSPLTREAIFPKQAYVWEFNYRGSLEFLHQAYHQAEIQELRIHDGWEYFLAGWAYVIAEVYHFELTAARFAELRAAAASLRPLHS